LRRDELPELHYITPIANVESICRHGILSHRQAKKVSHRSVAMERIQERRRRVVVPGGRPLHEYANLYICARNPMLYKLQAQHAALSVLRVSPAVLDLPGTVVVDGNASSKYVAFRPAPAGLAMVDKELVFAEYWTHPDDPIREYQHSVAKCAEVLVPDRIGPEFVTGAYVCCTESEAALRAQLALANRSPQVTVDRHLFFL
jgi:hypothetical protein